jgi:hypothetical protein
MAGYFGENSTFMKKMFVLIATVVFVNSCAPVVVVDSRPKPVVVQQKQAPPGQVKKTTGSKSAKEYAPGQQKKKN